MTIPESIARKWAIKAAYVDHHIPYVQEQILYAITEATQELQKQVEELTNNLAVTQGMLLGSRQNVTTLEQRIAELEAISNSLRADLKEAGDLIHQQQNKISDLERDKMRLDWLLEDAYLDEELLPKQVSIAVGRGFEIAGENQPLEQFKSKVIKAIDFAMSTPTQSKE